MEKIIFNVADYGAVGDGVTNDGLAIGKAVEAAKNSKSDACKEIVLDGTKTYRITSVISGDENGYLFEVDNIENLKISGDGCKLLFRGPLRLAYVHDSKNFEMENFVVDYSPKPFIIGKVTNFSCDECYIDFKTEEDVYLTPAPSVFQGWGFAFPNLKEKRYHYFIKDLVEQEAHSYRVTIQDNTSSRIAEVNVGDEFLLPMAGASHYVGAVCSVFDNNGFKFKGIRFYSHPEFGFDVRSNSGEMMFDNIEFKPEDGARENLVSWRDGFHIKDNTSPVIWKNCYIGPLGDDAFNLSCVHLDVVDVDQDGKTIIALPAEKGATRDLLVGDEYVAYDLQSGREIGRGLVEKVIASDKDVRFVCDTPMPLLQKGMQISFYRFANPGFKVIDSYIEGTVRIRSSGTFENCVFNVFWVRIENEYFVEGPVPRDINFKNCEFTTMYDTNAEILHVGSIGLNGLTNCEYKCKNIVLENCKFVKGQYYAEDGNDLIFI